jgi:hypothetical protein
MYSRLKGAKLGLNLRLLAATKLFRIFLIVVELLRDSITKIVCETAVQADA